MTGPVHTKVAAPAPQHVSRQRPMSKRGDPSEREADRAADVVARGGSVSGWSFANVPASNGASSGTSVQREPIDTPLTPAPKNEKDKYIAGGLAALDTPAGKVLKEKVLSLPVVKPVVDALSSPTGKKAILGAAAVGIGGLAAAGKELPVQLPAFNLDKLAKGLEGKVIVRGPLNAPTTFGIVLSYTTPDPTPKRSPKDQSTAAERADRIRDERLRTERALDPKRAAEDQQAEDEIIRMVVQRAGFPGVVIPIEPSKPAEAAPTADQPAPAEEKKKPDEAAPVQREPATTASSLHDAPTADVDDGLGGGRTLDPTTRRFMEARFGVDFSTVRIHDDARAAATARRIDAAAFTTGSDVVFGEGRLDTNSPLGRHLLAHELAHVVQQSRATPGRPPVQRRSAQSQGLVDRIGGSTK